MKQSTSSAPAEVVVAITATETATKSSPWITTTRPWIFLVVGMFLLFPIKLLLPMSRNTSDKRLPPSLSLQNPNSALASSSTLLCWQFTSNCSSPDLTPCVDKNLEPTTCYLNLIILCDITLPSSLLSEEITPRKVLPKPSEVSYLGSLVLLDKFPKFANWKVII